MRKEDLCFQTFGNKMILCGLVSVISGYGAYFTNIVKQQQYYRFGKGLDILAFIFALMNDVMRSTSVTIALFLSLPTMVAI